MIKLNKKNITKVLIEIQDSWGAFHANAIATQAVMDFNLQREHQRQTGNPKGCYKDFVKWSKQLKESTQ